MEKRQIILPEKRYEKAPSEELEIQVKLDEKNSLLTNDDRDIIVDVNEVFNQERNKSFKYKIYGKIRMIFRNMYSGTSEYTYLSRQLYLLGDGTGQERIGYMPYNEFAFLRNDICREEIKNRRVPDLSKFTGFTSTITGTTGSTEHKLITEINAPRFNWNVYLSYVYAQDENYPMKYTLSGNTEPLSFVSGDGIPFRVSDNGKSYKFTSPVDHGMAEGEYIIIDGYPYYINSIGDEIYNSENYVIDIFKSQVPSGTTTFSGLTISGNTILVTGKRCLDSNNMSGTTSQYYVHKHKIVTTDEDYIIDKSGFESPIWEDERKILFEDSTGKNDVIVERNRMESILYDFKTFFMLSGITNNFGYTPTEAYVTVIFRNSNGYFYYPPKVGYKFNFHNEWIDKQFDGSRSNESSLMTSTFTNSGFTFSAGLPLSIGDVLTGAFVEYNPTEMKERIICESFHKFSCDKLIFDYGQTGETTKLNYCPVCGDIISDGEKICDKCGYEFEDTVVSKYCPVCGDIISDGETICDKCGYEFEDTVVSKYCPVCGDIISDGEKICDKCGYEFEDEIIDNSEDSDSGGINFSGATPSNPFGLYYQPHYRVKLRELSPYIETSNSPDIDSLPENAKYYPEEKLWKWRDLYDHGYIDDLDYGVNHPFMNGIHYVKNDINFYLRNEKLYTNKSDGIFDFNSFLDKKKNNSKDKINC